MMRPFLSALGVTACLLAWPTTGSAQTIIGPADVVDGDSLSMTGTSIRLFGIDAPEGNQICQRNGSNWACGEEAKQKLAELVQGKDIKCQQQDTDHYGRMVAICHADYLDLARTMVEGGLAIALPQFTDAYLEAETRAKHHKLGIWGSSFQEPAAWRAANPSPEPKLAPKSRMTRPAAPSSRSYRNHLGCAIKGNRNRKGEWIYHLPGMPYYEATRPEDLFCTEAQAQAAGYRRAIVR